MLYYKKCVSKVIGRLLFSLFMINQYSMHNVILRVLSKSHEMMLFKLLLFSLLSKLYETFVNDCFLAYSLTFRRIP